MSSGDQSKERRAPDSNCWNFSRGFSDEAAAEAGGGIGGHCSAGGRIISFSKLTLCRWSMVRRWEERTLPTTWTPSTPSSTWPSQSLARAPCTCNTWRGEMWSSVRHSWYYHYDILVLSERQRRLCMKCSGSRVSVFLQSHCLYTCCWSSRSWQVQKLADTDQCMGWGGGGWEEKLAILFQYYLLIISEIQGLLQYSAE